MPTGAATNALSSALDADADPNTSSSSIPERRPKPPQRSHWGLLSPCCVWPVLTVLLSTLAMAQALQVWNWSPGTPLGLDGDNASVTTWVRTILDDGAYSDNLSMGAPYGQNLGWFATADDVHFLIIRALGLFTDSPFTVVAVYFFLGFPLAALATYWLARTEGLSYVSATLVGVLFSVLPSHQTRYPHLFLAAYWVLPLGIWVALRVARGLPVLRPPRGLPRGRGQLRTVLRSPNTLAVALIAVVALGGVYHAAFVLLLIFVALVARMVRHYDRRELVHGIATCGLLASLTLASLLRMYLRTRSDVLTGVPPSSRSASDSEQFAGKIIDLVLPWVHHRVDVLQQMAQAYNGATLATVEPSAIGVVALVGLTLILAQSLAALVRSRHPQPVPWATTYGLLTVTAIAFFTKGGLGAVFALFVTPQIRTWSRLYVVIALFGLLAVGHLLDRLDRLDRHRGRILAATVATAALVFGVADQTNPQMAPNYAATRAQLDDLRSFTHVLETTLAPGCSVFQLPVISFPGSPPVHNLYDYDLLLPYLASTQLTWSYGAAGGTARGDWQLALPTDRPAELADDVAAAGFCAIQVDTAGYQSASASPIADLRQHLGTELAASSDGRLVAFDLRPLAAALRSTRGADAVAATGERVLHPVVVGVRGSDVLTSDSGQPYQWAPGSTEVSISNMASAAASVTVAFDVAGPDPVARSVRVTAPGAAPQSASVSSTAPHRFTVTLAAPLGVTEVHVNTEGSPVNIPGPKNFSALARIADVTASVAEPGTVVGVLQQRNQ